MGSNPAKRKFTIQALVIGACVVLLAVYGLFDPARRFFPRCPFHMLTGLDCPGCGSQRAVHSLLHGDVSTAFGYNQLLVVMLPYLAVCIWLEYFGGKHRFPWLRRVLLGKEACIVLLAVFILFFVGRNFLF